MLIGLAIYMTTSLPDSTQRAVCDIIGLYSYHGSAVFPANVTKWLRCHPSPHALPKLLEEAHGGLPFLLTILRLFALPHKTLLVDLRLTTPDIRLR